MKVGDLVTHNVVWLSDHLNHQQHKKLFDAGIVTEIRPEASSGRVFVRVVGSNDDLCDMWFVGQELEILNETKQSKES